MLEQNNLIKGSAQWEIINHTEIIHSFPIMSQDDLGDLTFGNKNLFKNVPTI